jgi:hypothetical protein
MRGNSQTKINYNGQGELIISSQYMESTNMHRLSFLHVLPQIEKDKGVGSIQGEMLKTRSNGRYTIYTKHTIFESV